ncbi:MAG: AarF/UbiB family protein, partial [Acidobacteriota bacterium]
DATGDALHDRDGSDAVPRVDRRRYRRLVRFFFGVFVNVLIGDVLLQRPALRLLRPDPLPRWRRLARRYRLLAAREGGVLIKLGQYLSTRVDVLPRAVTDELAGLQDTVPPAPHAVILAGVEADLGRPAEALFTRFDRTPLGAASLAQVHGARLRDGRSVVIKALRPNIETLVDTDLRAITRALGWLRAWRAVRSRVDLDRLIESFEGTLRAELDLRQEGRNAERFAENFADDPQIRAPAIVWSHVGRRTLAQENVAFIKLGDLAALDAADIDRPALAQRLYASILRQVVEHGFVHADPHPGNLFVRPADDDLPEQLIFVDFGMVAEIPDSRRAFVRALLSAVGRRDSAGTVRALVDAGILRPGADVPALVEAVETLYERFWSVGLGRLNDAVQDAAEELWRAFGQLLATTPVQAPVDLVFAGRALELLSGLATQLDPEFKPGPAVMRAAARLVADEAAARGPAEIGREALAAARDLADLPFAASRVLRRLDGDRLTVRTSLTPDGRRRWDNLERALERLAGAVITAALLVAGALLWPELPLVGGLLLIAAALRAVVATLGRWLQ